jgi:hypothetical protein
MSEKYPRTKILGAFAVLKLENGWGRMPPPKPYNPHYVEKLRLWDLQEQRMDYDVIISDGHVLIPGEQVDVDNYKAGTLSWTTEQTAVIAGHPHFRMALDDQMIVQRMTPCVDKNGAEVWEGDYLMTPEGVMIVGWARIMQYWCCMNTFAEGLMWPHAHTLFDTVMVSEKIGSRYENPEIENKGGFVAAEAPQTAYK